MTELLLASPLLAALKRKYRTPQEALRALGLDEALLDAENDAEKPPIIIAHDEAWAPHKGEPPVNDQEQRLMRALRTRFASPIAVMRRLGMDEDLLDNDEEIVPDPSETCDRIVQMFADLGPEDRAAVMETLSQMATNSDGETPGDAERRRYAQDRSLPYRDARSAAAVGTFAQRFPNAAKIGNGW